MDDSPLESSPTFHMESNTFDNADDARQIGKRTLTLNDFDAPSQTSVARKLAEQDRLRTMTMQFGTSDSINAAGRWPADGERSSFETEQPRHDPLSNGTLADTVLRALSEDQAPLGRECITELSGGVPRGGGGGIDLSSTVEKVLKSKQVQDAIRTSARKAAAEALESLMRSITNIEMRLSSRIQQLEEAMVVVHKQQEEATRAKTKSRDFGGPQGPYVPAGPNSDLWTVLDANRHALSGQHQASNQPARSGRIDAKNFASDPRGAKQGQGQRLDAQNFGSDPRGTKVQRLDAQNFVSDPRGSKQGPGQNTVSDQRGRQMLPQQGQPAQKGNQQRLNSADFNSAPARTGPPGMSSNQKQPMTIRDIEAYQLERLLMESAMDTIREGKRAAPKHPNDRALSPTRDQGQAAASSKGQPGFSVIPGSMGAASSSPLPQPSGPSSGHGREPGPTYPNSDPDGAMEVTSNVSPGSSDAETASNSKKKSNRIRNFFNMGWNRSSTS